MKRSPVFRIAVCVLGVIAVLGLFSGCGERPSEASHGHSHADGEAHDHGDKPATPHGGTPVMVAEEKFHLELVLDPSSGKMQAYVLDGHLEGYVPVSETEFVIEARSKDATHQLKFVRMPEATTATLEAKSSLFEAQADWLKTVEEFEGTIPTITLNGSTFKQIGFPFPKGTQHVH